MPDFDFDIKKKEWRPKCVDDIVQEVSRSFETQVSPTELAITGTDYLQNKKIVTDADLFEWLKTESKTYEKFIKVKVPTRLLPRRWLPKKQMVLTKSKDNIIAKYFGDEEVSTRQVQFTLKILDCGHFRLKQTLQGSGPSPYWVIFEGKWERTPRGFKLEFCIRYPFQKNKRDEFDLAFEAMPDTHDTSLAFTDETERQLAGNLPAIVGTDLYSWIELVQEHEVESNPQTRFNPEEQQEEADAPPEPAPTSAPATSTPAVTVPKEEEEGLWQMYLGLGLFLVLVLAMSWMHWGSLAAEEL